MSFPLFGETMVFTQPDGTKFDARGWGDQQHARFETPAGNPVVRDPVTRYFHYATTAPGSDLLRPTTRRVGIEPPPPSNLAQGPRVAPQGGVTTPPDSVLLRPRCGLDGKTDGSNRKLLSASRASRAEPCLLRRRGKPSATTSAFAC